MDNPAFSYNNWVIISHKADFQKLHSRLYIEDFDSRSLTASYLTI